MILDSERKNLTFQDLCKSGHVFSVSVHQLALSESERGIEEVRTGKTGSSLQLSALLVKTRCFYLESCRVYIYVWLAR